MKIFRLVMLSLLSVGSLSFGAEAQNLSLWGRIRSYFPLLMTNEEFEEYSKKEFDRIQSQVKEDFHDLISGYEHHDEILRMLEKSFLSGEDESQTVIALMCNGTYQDRLGKSKGYYDRRVFSGNCAIDYLQRIKMKAWLCACDLNNRSLGSTDIAKKCKLAELFLSRWENVLRYSFDEIVKQEKEKMRVKAEDNIRNRLNSLEQQVNRLSALK